MFNGKSVRNLEYCIDFQVQQFPLGEIFEEFFGTSAGLDNESISYE